MTRSIRKKVSSTQYKRDRTQSLATTKKSTRLKAASVSVLVALLLLALPAVTFANNITGESLAKLLQVAVGGDSAPPIVNTTISVAKTGSEPFDTDDGKSDGPNAQTWDTDAETNAGLDGSEDNNVVRMQDSITYKVEVSANDAAVDNLFARVELDALQAWIAIPTGCGTDPDEFDPVSTISEDKRTLICNLGPAIEGTARVVYPAARAIGVSHEGDVIGLNDVHVQTSVYAWGEGPTGTEPTDSSPTGSSVIATDGPTDVIVTAGFKLDTTKELKVTALDPDTDEPLYSAPAKLAEDGTTQGSVIEYVVKSTYLSGSMIANAPDEDNGNFEIDFTLLDHSQTTM